ncbi:MAG: YdcH family protein [Phenylobacterium sp.]
MSEPQNPIDESEARRRLAELQLDHSDLEVAIQAIGQSPVPDMLVIGRLKRKKLALKDQIQRLKDQLTPDIIA